MQVKEFNIQTELMRSCILLQNTEVYDHVNLSCNIQQAGKTSGIDLLSKCVMKIWGWSDARLV